MPLTAAAAEAAAIALFGPGISGDNRNSLGEQTPRDSSVRHSHTHTCGSVCSADLPSVIGPFLSPSPSV